MILKIVISVSANEVVSLEEDETKIPSKNKNHKIQRASVLIAAPIDQQSRSSNPGIVYRLLA